MSTAEWAVTLIWAALCIWSAIKIMPRMPEIFDALSNAISRAITPRKPTQIPTVAQDHAQRLREWDADYQRLMDETGETERIRREATAQIARNLAARLQEISNCGCGSSVHAVKTWSREMPVRVIHDCKRDAA